MNLISLASDGQTICVSASMKFWKAGIAFMSFIDFESCCPCRCHANETSNWINMLTNMSMSSVQNILGFAKTIISWLNCENHENFHENWIRAWILWHFCTFLTPSSWNDFYTEYLLFVNRPWNVCRLSKHFEILSQLTVFVDFLHRPSKAQAKFSSKMQF